MIITREILEQHDACEGQVGQFAQAFPDGCPVPRSKDEQVTLILRHQVIRENWGWAVYWGITPSWSMHSQDLSGANLRYANLRRANLSEADLSETDLYGATLRFADLRFANLRNATLSGADLHCADLHCANLSGADLRFAFVRGAQLPAGFDAEAAGAIT